MSDPQFYDNLNHNPFVGQPTPQVDAAWHDLLDNIHLRVSKEELERAKQSSIELPEGGGHLAWLAVYHELHCLVGRTTFSTQSPTQTTLNSFAGTRKSSGDGLIKTTITPT